MALQASLGILKKEAMTKIVCISDTHCQLEQVQIPDGDILVHAGDLTYRGTVSETSKELLKLSKHRARFKEIILVEGNHDWLGFHNPTLMDHMCKDNGIILLRDSGVTIDDLKFYGSPHQPEFHDWAFNLPRGEPLKQKWALIPDDTNVLITHSPLHSILDEVPYPSGFRAGCVDLYNRVMELKDLKLSVFGHLHMNHGSVSIDGKTYVNASVCTENYKPTNAPIIISI